MRGTKIESCTWLKVPIDLALSSLTLLIAYWLAVAGIPVELSRGVPQLGNYVQALPAVLAVFFFLAVFFRLYRPRRAGSFGPLIGDILKVNFQAALVVMAFSFYYRDFTYSRVIVTSFFALNPFVLFLHHLGWMEWERHLATEGIGTRRCLIVGRGELARAIAERVEQHPWTGLSVAGFLALESEENVATHEDLTLGTTSDLSAVIVEHNIREVIVAVPFRSMQSLMEIDEELAQSTVGLQWVPDLEALNTLHREVTDIEDMHLINLRGTPLRGFSRFAKRSFDIILSATLLVLTAPLMAAIALVIRATSGSPVLYRQERVGLDGRVFTLLKYRTMVTDAERESGPVFATTDDTRCTPIGLLLRRTSLDELPQLWNILVGHMSLVGPRPERPVFIEEFTKTIPRYMLRHRMKAGLTGWAQVNGWRGNTSLRKRIQCDLYYLKHWTLWFDVKILLLTLVRGWRRRWNAY